MKMKNFFKTALCAGTIIAGIAFCCANLNVEAKGLKDENHDVITRSSGTDWVNIGTRLPEPVDYFDDDGSRMTTLINTVKKGDIFYTPNGSSYVFGNTGHLAIIEGVFFDEVQNQRYIRTIEANPCGVKRGCLTKERFKACGGGTILRVKNVSWNEVDAAVEFCKNQLDKGYELNIFRYPHETGDTWYCSELVWAAYYNATKGRISLDPCWDGGNMVFWPFDVTKSSHVECVDNIKGYYHTYGSFHKKLINGCYITETCEFSHNQCKKCHYTPTC